MTADDAGLDRLHLRLIDAFGVEAAETLMVSIRTGERPPYDARKHLYERLVAVIERDGADLLMQHAGWFVPPDW